MWTSQNSILIFLCFFKLQCEFFHVIENVKHKLTFLTKGLSTKWEKPSAWDTERLTPQHGKSWTGLLGAADCTPGPSVRLLLGSRGRRPGPPASLRSWLLSLCRGCWRNKCRRFAVIFSTFDIWRLSLNFLRKGPYTDQYSCNKYLQNFHLMCQVLVLMLGVNKK